MYNDIGEYVFTSKEEAEEERKIFCHFFCKASSAQDAENNLLGILTTAYPFTLATDEDLAPTDEGDNTFSFDFSGWAPNCYSSFVMGELEKHGVWCSE